MDGDEPINPTRPSPSRPVQTTRGFGAPSAAAVSTTASIASTTTMTSGVNSVDSWRREIGGVAVASGEASEWAAPQTSAASVSARTTYFEESLSPSSRVTSPAPLASSGLTFAKRPLPARGPTAPLASAASSLQTTSHCLSLSRTPSISESSLYGGSAIGGIAPLPSHHHHPQAQPDPLPPTLSSPRAMSTVSDDTVGSETGSSQVPPPTMVSLLSQILVAHQREGRFSCHPAQSAQFPQHHSPLSSVPNSGASSPASGSALPLPGIFRRSRRGSVNTSAMEGLEEVGEEEDEGKVAPEEEQNQEQQEAEDTPPSMPETATSRHGRPTTASPIAWPLPPSRASSGASSRSVSKSPTARVTRLTFVNSARVSA